MTTPNHANGASTHATPLTKYRPPLSVNTTPGMNGRYGTGAGSYSSLASTTNPMHRNPLICPLCLQYFTDPIMLPCLHSFCMKCIDQLKRESTQNSSLKCPTCGSSKGLSCEMSIKQLPKNLWLAHQVEIATYEDKLGSGSHDVPCDRCVKQANGFSIVFCSECCLFLCRSCSDDHKWCKDTVKHDLIDVGRALKRSKSNPTAAAKAPIVLQSKPVKCSKHSGENYKFYCQSCDVLICQECMVHEHKGHENIYLEQMASQCRSELQEWLDKCNYALTDLDIAIGNVEEMHELLQERKKEVENEIDTNCEMLHKALEERRRVLREKCKDISEGKADVLQSQMEAFQRIRQVTEHTIIESSNAITNQSSAEVVSTKRVILEQMKQAFNQFQQMSLSLSSDDVITTAFNVTCVTERISQFGSFTDLCIPQKSGVQHGLAIPYAVVGKKRQIRIVMRDDCGLPMKSLVPFQVSLVGKGEQESITQKVDVTQCQDGSTELSFTPITSGYFQLFVSIRSEGISGSPFSLHFREERNYCYMEKSPQIFSVGQHTYGVAVHHSGDVFASNSVSGCIQVFNKDGTEKDKFGKQGSGNGQLSKPWGLALDRDVLYVVDRGNRRIVLFSAINGEYLGQFGAADLTDPMSICLDNCGHAFVTDGPKQAIQVFSTEGVYKYTIQCNTYPYDVAIDNTGYIHVAYYNNTSVQLFSSEGGRKSSLSSPQTQHSSIASLLSPPHFNISGSISMVSDLITGMSHRNGKGSSSIKQGGGGEGGGEFIGGETQQLQTTNKPSSATFNNSCIQVFSPDGKRGLYSYSTDENLVYPTGLAMDDEGYRFIADSNHHCLRVLNPTGKEIHQCTGLNFPYGVTIDVTGHVYVADSSNHRIVKY
ncbi:PREDICTED: tripartite motif-containing protein 2-like [Amphimedon queenslandica]|nr:PREDICTED: tripartite motif-containing protein 2-like [Amphimedon queenslandica]|eukprot:XP_019856250.1 PREDICTED: tripartite motif-containing protein 2-like [Amphimedon queenslandica]